MDKSICREATDICRSHLSRTTMTQWKDDILGKPFRLPSSVSDANGLSDATSGALGGERPGVSGAQDPPIAYLHSSVVTDRAARRGAPVAAPRRSCAFRGSYESK